MNSLSEKTVATRLAVAADRAARGQPRHQADKRDELSRRCALRARTQAVLSIKYIPSSRDSTNFQSRVSVSHDRIEANSEVPSWTGRSPRGRFRKSFASFATDAFCDRSGSISIMLGARLSRPKLSSSSRQWNIITLGLSSSRQRNFAKLLASRVLRDRVRKRSERMKIWLAVRAYPTVANSRAVSV